MMKVKDEISVRGEYVSVFMTPSELARLKRLSESLSKPPTDVIRDYVRNAAAHGGYDPRVHKPLATSKG